MPYIWMSKCFTISNFLSYSSDFAGINALSFSEDLSLVDLMAVNEFQFVNLIG